MTAKRSGSAYTASWDLLSSKGDRAAAGSYTYKVAVRTPTGVTGSTAGAVTLVFLGESVAIPITSRWLGFYDLDVPVNMAPLTALESSIGGHAAVIHFFISDWESFPLSRVQTIAAHGSIPMVSIDFVRTCQDRGVDSIISGEMDQYLHDWAAAAKTYGGVVWIRPFPEMNGNWSCWCGVVGTNTTAKTVAAWKHVHDIFVAEGASNVKFVWNVNSMSIPDNAENAIEKYWPGDDYVDYVSVDGYNWGTSASWSSWSMPAQIFDIPYKQITALTNKPFFIAETASTPVGGDKPAWITDLFKSMATRYPKIVGVCWFNQNKEQDWRMDQNDATLAAMKQILRTGF